MKTSEPIQTTTATRAETNTMMRVESGGERLGTLNNLAAQSPATTRLGALQRKADITPIWSGTAQPLAATVQRIRPAAGPLASLGGAVVQRIKVGDEGARKLQLAYSRFPRGTQVALIILGEFEEAGREFGDVDDIVRAALEDDRMAEYREEAEAELAVAEAAAAAVTEREESDEVHRWASRIKTYIIKDFDIKNGTFRQLGRDEDGGRNRPDTDYTLIMNVADPNGAFEVTCHMHGPRFTGGAPTPGGFRIAGKDQGNTPMAIINASLGHHGRAAEWDRASRW